MDPILFWNESALEANRLSHTYGLDTGALGPTQSSRTLAIFHTALYEAYAAVMGNPAGLEVYDAGRPNAPANISAAGALTGTAINVLQGLYPQTSLRPEMNLAGKYAMALSDAGNPPNWGAGVNYGGVMAAYFLAERGGDPNSSDLSYAPPVGRSNHQPDPDHPLQGYHGPKYGHDSKCFAVTKRHALDTPPQLGTVEYNRAVTQVRGRGIASELLGSVVAPSVRRAVDETVIGIYWGYDGAKQLGTPPRLYNQVIRTLAIAKNNTIAQNARLFALVNLAMGDSGILAWEQKYVYNVWRPVIGIRNHDSSMGQTGTTNATNNINDLCDINWKPLGGPRSNDIGKNFTPPFPAYPSGHATFGAAAFHIARLFYGVTAWGNDNLFDGLSFVSDELNGITTDNQGTVRPRHQRNFPRGLWQMIEENGFSRVYLGVHWSFDSFAVKEDGTPDLSKNIGGVPLGLNIAEDIFNSGMKKSSIGPVI